LVVSSFLVGFLLVVSSFLVVLPSGRSMTGRRRCRRGCRRRCRRVVDGVVDGVVPSSWSSGSSWASSRASRSRRSREPSGQIPAPRHTTAVSSCSSLQWRVWSRQEPLLRKVHSKTGTCEFIPRIKLQGRAPARFLAAGITLRPEASRRGPPCRRPSEDRSCPACRRASPAIYRYAYRLSGSVPTRKTLPASVLTAHQNWASCAMPNGSHWLFAI